MLAVLRPRSKLIAAAVRFDYTLGRRWKTKAKHTPQQIAAGEFVKNEATLPIKELVTLRDVIYLLNLTGKHLIKKSVLQEYGLPVKEIILYIYNPYIRMYLTSAGLKKYLERKNEDVERVAEVEHNSILTVLNELQSREITGNAALKRVASLLHYIRQFENRVKDDCIALKPTLEDVLYRCLDRNLRAGINKLTVHEAFGHGLIAKVPPLRKKWPAYTKIGANSLLTSTRKAIDFESRPVNELEIKDSDTFHEVTYQNGMEDNSLPEKNYTSSINPSLAPYGVALGKSSSLESFRRLFEGGPSDVLGDEEGPSSWYMSRKLDGVRCIVRIDFDVSEGVKSPLQIVNVETMSRTERPFTSLDVLKEELKILLSECPSIVGLVEKAYGRKSPSTSDLLQTISIYLDGELCVLVPEKEVKNGETLESPDNFMEDFSEIVGIVRRKSYTVTNPAFFPFDILTEVEFQEWRLQDENPEDHEPFFIRKERVKNVVKYCQDRKSVIVRKLDQTLVKTFDQVVASAEEATAKKWEGLILRKGSFYEGKRSSSIRKFKRWLDAEYTVCDVQKAVMRLPVDQVYEDRNVMASVTIKHKDIEVFVGSGFTVEERIRYGADPSLIIGKEITVQYFSESSSATRAKEGDSSLRFPRVKMVWEDENRDL